MLFKNKITDYDWLVIIDQRLTEVAYELVLMMNDQQRLLFWLTVPTHDPTHSWAMGTGQ